MIRLWDNREKAYFYDSKTDGDMTFKTVRQAENYKMNYLALGNYPDQPHTVIQIVKGGN